MRTDLYAPHAYHDFKLMGFARIYADIVSNGGISINLFGQYPRTGYMVSLDRRESVIRLADFGPSVIDAYILANADALEGAYFGAWVEDDRVYLDVSYNVLTEELARDLGKLNHQRAVYDIERGETIYLQEV